MTKRLKKILLTPISQLYIAGVKARHALFDMGILRSERPSIPTICVGNITVGGCGKSPMCELLIRKLSSQYNIAVISRGYGRKSKGYMEVAYQSNYLDVGDEPLQIKRKFPSIVVVVCERRVEGVRRIQREHPEIDLVIMDDGFQHRYIKPHCNIVMVDATRPTFEDLPLPAGSLRDTPDALSRANLFVVSKSPNSIRSERIVRFHEALLHNKDQAIFFSKIVNASPLPMFPNEAEPFDPSMDVVLMSGIANPAPLHEWLDRHYQVVQKFTYPDHHRYSVNDLQRITTLLRVHPNTVIVTTEKDMVKLLDDKSLTNTIRKRIYYTPIEMEFIAGSSCDELIRKIESYVQQD